jgi:hypothetical protein
MPRCLTAYVLFFVVVVHMPSQLDARQVVTTAREEPEAIWSSDQVHLVDALAATGDEGRCSLR